MKASVPGELQFYHEEENEGSSEHRNFNYILPFSMERSSVSTLFLRLEIIC